MVALPTVESYTTVQLSEARRTSPALAAYLGFLQTPTRDHTGEIRLLRHRAWSECALAIIHNKATPEQVCSYWSAKTREILAFSWKHHGLENSPICLVTMGKLGAGELNLSSDIDVFFVGDEAVEKQDLRKVRAFVQGLNDVTTLGFGYRVDMDLRPGGSTAPLVISFDQMTNHYGYQGETWERVAMVRQHVMFGTDVLRTSVAEFCRKFAFRKHIDYSLFSDLLSMRERIRARHEEIGSQDPSVLNLKFNPGGIRELELFVHSLQLIHGGKHPSLATPSTTQALQELKSRACLPAPEADLLLETYWFYRDLENRAQIINDHHTYELTAGNSALVPAAQKVEFKTRALAITSLVDQFLAPYKEKANFVSEQDLNAHFASLNLNSEDAAQAWEKLLRAEVRSKEKTRDEQERRKFLGHLLAHLRECGGDTQLALQNLSRFITAVKAKASLFTLFNTHEKLTAELVWIFSSSPYLSQIFIHRPELIDSFLLNRLDIDRSDEGAFYKSLQDYKLLAELMVSSAFLRSRDVDALTENLSRTTDTIIGELLAYLKTKTGAEVDILALGKWASREMGLASDLDFVFITDKQPNEKHFKMARRFINFLHSSATGLTLYNIDLRLRPTGHAGPLLMTLEDLRVYLADKAQIWERQAYLNNRLLSADASIELFPPRALAENEKTELAGIQHQLLGSDENAIDLKKSLGGLAHTEFTLQIALLQEGLRPANAGVAAMTKTLTAKHGDICEKILANYTQLRLHQQLIILVSGGPHDRFKEDSPAFVKLCSLSKTTPKVLFAEINSLLEEQRELLNRLDPLAAGFRI